MQRIAESIEIHRPPQDVFAFLRDIEARVRLNPSYTVIGFEALTHPEMCAGARYRFFLMADGKRTRHECEVTEVVENKKIVSRAVDDSLRLTLTLKETPRGTLLTHDEKFFLPQEVLDRPGRTNPRQFFQELWPKAQHLTAGLGFYDKETEERMKELEEALRSNLRTWLERVREKIESRNT